MVCYSGTCIPHNPDMSAESQPEVKPLSETSWAPHGYVLMHPCFLFEMHECRVANDFAGVG